eukprot:CAMPEP_0194396860 /NCGR_PEP_ID=MMETSP0174-20130528/125219_1 /TAXON_ID=216777 /ORGANISM="Proboscia alata, Strain PI-D3" /LENGTH=280 /DNA_ID=CAMNT_0039192967 /DNA_START=333 /DNA_END=1176 /DNA_ORIENTATION=+
MMQQRPPMPLRFDNHEGTTCATLTKTNTKQFGDMNTKHFGVMKPDNNTCSLGVRGRLNTTNTESSSYQSSSRMSSEISSSGSSVSSDESSNDTFEEMDERLDPKIVNKRAEVEGQQEQLLHDHEAQQQYLFFGERGRSNTTNTESSSCQSSSRSRVSWASSSSGSSVSSDESSNDTFEEMDERLDPKIVNKRAEVEGQQEQLLPDSAMFQTQQTDYGTLSADSAVKEVNMMKSSHKYSLSDNKRAEVEGQQEQLLHDSVMFQTQQTDVRSSLRCTCFEFY